MLGKAIMTSNERVTSNNEEVVTFGDGEVTYGWVIVTGGEHLAISNKGQANSDWVTCDKA